MDKITSVYLCATIGGMLFGYDTAIVNGGLVQMSEHFGFHLESWISGLVVSIGVFASFFGAILTGYLSNTHGRRKSMHYASIFFILSSIVAAVAWNMQTVYFSRVLFGLSIGCVSVVVPIYLSEISPAKTRGKIITINNIALTCGQVLASVVAYSFIHLSSGVGWRFMFGLGAIPAILQLWLLARLPETPRWLRQNDRRQEAEVITKEFGLEEEEVQQSEKDQQMSFNIIRRMYSNRDIRFRLFIACGMHFFQQFAGINTVMYYSAMVLKEVGFEESTSALAWSIPLAMTNAIFTCIGLLTIDKYGRRKTCIASLTGCFVSITGVVVLAFVRVDALSSGIRAILFFCLLTMYLMFFAPGMGPVPWLVASEIFPTSYRSAGMAMGAMVNWLSNAVVSQIFPIVIGRCGVGWAFLCVDVFVLLGLAFVYFLLPETRRKTLEEISRMNLC